MIAGLIAALLAAPPATATPPPVAEVTVTAPPATPAPTLAQREDAVQAVLATPHDQQTARWGQPYCPRVSGLEPGQEARLAAAMAGVARAAGLAVGPADCQLNVLVIVADDPNAELERLLARGDRFFGDAMAGEVRKALGGERPVHWFAVARKLSADGMPLGPSTFKFRVGHILSTERYDLSGVVVLVDAARVDGLSLSALADYLAMVTLAQVKADRPSPHPATVLDLFADPAADRARAPGLTEWDRGFLKGLYALDPAASPGMQRWGIARTMAGAPAGR